MPGKFIVVEGPDNMGKTTAIRECIRNARDNGKTIELIKFPQTIPSGTSESNYDHFVNEMQCATTWIKEMMDRDAIVIADRYIYSANVYRSLDAHMLRGEPLTIIPHKEHTNLITPNILIHVIDPEPFKNIDEKKKEQCDNFTKELQTLYFEEYKMYSGLNIIMTTKENLPSTLGNQI